MNKFICATLASLCLFGCETPDTYTQTVRINSIPEGAIISVNNLSFGKTPVSVQFESNGEGNFIARQLINALPQTADSYTHSLGFPAFNGSNAEESKIPSEIIFNMQKSSQEEGGVQIKK